MTAPVSNRRSSLREELSIVSPAAYWVVACVFVLIGLLVFLLMLRGRALEPAVFLFLMILPFTLLAVYIILVFYVNADSRRRQMNPVVWTLVAALVPHGMGILVYFLMRKPLALPCPKCGATQAGRHAFCPSCGEPLGGVCSSCRRAVEPGWKVCAHCGAGLSGEVAPRA